MLAKKNNIKALQKMEQFKKFQYAKKEKCALMERKKILFVGAFLFGGGFLVEVENDFFCPDVWNKKEYENRCGELIAQFCQEFMLSLGLEKYNLDDLRKDTQSAFYAALKYVHEHTFEHNNYILKNHAYREQTNNKKYQYTTGSNYNYDVISDIADIYINYCSLLNKIPDQQGFIFLTGISYQTFNTWMHILDNNINDNSNNNIYSDGNSKESLNKKKYEIISKIKTSKRAYLEARTTDGKQNPVGCIAILNNEFYNVQTAQKDSGERVNLLAELPELALIGDNAQKKDDSE